MRADIYIYIYIYIYVQKNVWHPPDGKCHVLRRRRGTLWYPLPKCSIWVKDLAVRWCGQLKSKTCILKKVVCFKMEERFQQKRLNYISDEDSRELQKLKKKERKD